MYKPGKWWMICDVCGFKYYNDELKQRWDGSWCCEKDWETRHPQEFGRTVKDKMAVPYSRPRPTDTFIDVPYIE